MQLNTRPMEVCCQDIHFPSCNRQQQDGDGGSGGGSGDQSQASQRPVNGQHDISQVTATGAAAKPQFLDGNCQAEGTPNDHAQGIRRPADVSGGVARVGNNSRPNDCDLKSGNALDLMLPNGVPSGSHHVRALAARPDCPLDGPAGLHTRRSSSGSNNALSPGHAIGSAYGPHRLHSGHAILSSAGRQRHSHGGPASPEGGSSFPRKQSHPYPLRLSRTGVAAPHSGAAISPLATAAVASARPYPGAFIRYVVAPLMLLPFSWPWLLLRSMQAMLGLMCLTAAVMADGLILLADLLRRNRHNAEILATWAAAWLAWVVGSYWAILAQLHMGCEDFLNRISLLLTPLLAAALRRSPAAARIAGLITPVMATAAKAQAAMYGAYCFVHDEIVPVALDLAERLPLVHWLLHRAVEGGSA
ncbi:hypothetical protein Vretimale_11192 [Volvox reticuliferus]|uniref:Uncharacterized protein n=1 Tax=Volvox reticuliferus TaxID=1737510 RepID=A0A8J4GGZ0_9CHLO|nr:hypothetical protein Vretifemale_11997 [Volvox reticuliferus]GIM06973.1 hypothetical protein Vretimale_11192 [Volvox reticuliferus]